MTILANAEKQVDVLLVCFNFFKIALDSLEKYHTTDISASYRDLWQCLQTLLRSFSQILLNLIPVKVFRSIKFISGMFPIIFVALMSNILSQKLT